MRQKNSLLLAILLAVNAYAIITVRTSGGDYNNLQAAINAATGTETIIVGDGTYTGTGNYNIMIDKEGINLTIESENGPDNCIFDAQNNVRVIGISNVNSADSVTIRGLTLIDGNDITTWGGGGLYSHNSVVTLEDCVIKNNASSKGGGIYTAAVAGSLVMNNCVIEGNLAKTSSAGGGMYISAQSVTATGCIFRDNTILPTASHAGGMYINNSNVVFRNCIFEGNQATGSGGCFYLTQSDGDFTNCDFVGNACSANGGVGFIYGSSTYPTIVNVKNCIFWNNTADNTADIFQTSAYYSGDTTLNYSYSDIDPGEISGFGTINNLGNNFYTDPLFASNGYRSVPGTWVAGDYHLQSMAGRWDSNLQSWVTDSQHSNCIDVGDPTDDYSVEPSHNGGRINVGAYGNTAQASQGSYCPHSLSADITGDCHVTMADFAEMAKQWLTCDMIPPSACWQ